MIVGTAGHIDHGKTALVQRAHRHRHRPAEGGEGARHLDRSRLRLPAGTGRRRVLGFVDVPGHERFVAQHAGRRDRHRLRAAGRRRRRRRHAADPRAPRHRRPARRPARRRGADQGRPRRPPERVAEVEPRSRSALLGTGLGGRRSSRSRRSPARASTRCASAARAPRARAARAPRRAASASPVDRAFTLAGAGTVVTGTVLVRRGARRRPRDRQPVRARGARALDPRAEPPAERGTAGERCALNLAGDGVSKERSRAATSCSTRRCTRRPTASMRRLRGARRRAQAARAMDCRCACITRRRDVAARVALLGERDRARRERPWSSSCSTPDRARPAHDRFVLRDATAQRTHRRRPRPRPARAGAQAPRAGAPRAARRAARAEDPQARARGAARPSRPVVDLAGFARDRALAASEIDAHGGRRAVVRIAGAASACRRRCWQRLARAARDARGLPRGATRELAGIGLRAAAHGARAAPAVPAFAAMLQSLARAHDGCARRRLGAAAGACGAAHARATRRCGHGSCRCSARPSASGRRGCATSPARLGVPEPDVRRLLKLLGAHGQGRRVRARPLLPARRPSAEMVDDRASTSRRQADGGSSSRRSSATGSTTAARSRSRSSNSSTATA